MRAAPFYLVIACLAAALAVARLRGGSFRVGNGAVVVLDVETGDVLALAGSADYFDFQAEGQFNAAVAGRQPGSRSARMAKLATGSA